MKGREVTVPAISGTAGNMALIRALETVKPERERLFTDPFAHRFLPPWQRALVDLSRIPLLRKTLETYFDGRAPGARTSGAVRTKLIDDWIGEALADGVRQIVILGAGFDCRALRLKTLADIPVFEVDRAAMIAFKNAALIGVNGPHVIRVAVDFQKDVLRDRLLAAGFAQDVKSLFVWEGVTNYLDAAAVGAVFEFVVRSASTGSKIVFTYIHADAVEGSFAAPGLTGLLEHLRAIGEPWTFGFHPEELRAYLARKGLRLLADLGATEYRGKYLRPAPQRPVGYEFYRAALAEVATNADSDAAG
jgi:methyltransferase (TIGR00027 family)